MMKRRKHVKRARLVLAEEDTGNTVAPGGLKRHSCSSYAGPGRHRQNCCSRSQWRVRLQRAFSKPSIPNGVWTAQQGRDIAPTMSCCASNKQTSSKAGVNEMYVVMYFVEKNELCNLTAKCSLSRIVKTPLPTHQLTNKLRKFGIFYQPRILFSYFLFDLSTKGAAAWGKWNTLPLTFFAICLFPPLLSQQKRWTRESEGLARATSHSGNIVSALWRPHEKDASFTGTNRRKTSFRFELEKVQTLVSKAWSTSGPQRWCSTKSCITPRTVFDVKIVYVVLYISAHGRTLSIYSNAFS